MIDRDGRGVGAGGPASRETPGGGSGCIAVMASTWTSLPLGGLQRGGRADYQTLAEFLAAALAGNAFAHAFHKCPFIGMSAPSFLALLSRIALRCRSARAGPYLRRGLLAGG